MKTTLLALFILMGNLAIFSGEAEAQPRRREVNISVGDAIFPAGFDRNSEVTVVLSGILPNGCYSFSRTDVSRSVEGVQIQAKATVREGMCMMVLIPFSKEVSLGRLGAGRHTVQFMNGDGTYWEKTVSIE